MAATGMFEKAVSLAVESDSEFGHRAKLALAVRHMDWNDEESVETLLPKLLPIYGLSDYQAIALLDKANSETHYLVERIRRGMFFGSIARFKWADMHYLSKQTILGLSTDKRIFDARRKLELYLAKAAKCDPLHIVCHVQRYPSSRMLTVGTCSGGLLEESSALGAFLTTDARHNYATEVFVDPSLDKRTGDAIRQNAINAFGNGNLINILVQP
jgi:hypothetical protein